MNKIKWDDGHGKDGLEPIGKVGIEARFRETAGEVYVYGSDSWWDWLHHIMPFARRREINWARDLVSAIRKTGFDGALTFAGHSMGAVIAIIASALWGNCHTTLVYGGKQSPRRYLRKTQYIAYRRTGDIVPFLAFWRPRYKNNVYGERLPFWEAHVPRSYESVRKF